MEYTPEQQQIVDILGEAQLPKLKILSELRQVAVDKGDSVDKVYLAASLVLRISVEDTLKLFKAVDVYERVFLGIYQDLADSKTNQEGVE